MKEDQQQVFCQSNVCKEESGLLFFEEKAELSHSDLDNSVVKHELHELTVSYEESDYNVVKDICVDEGGKISIESCFRATLPSDQDKNRAIQEDDDSKLLSEDQSKPRDVDCDVGDVSDECTTKEKEDIEPLIQDCLKISPETALLSISDVAQMPSEEAKVESSDKTLASRAVQVQCSDNAREDKPNAEDKASNYLSAGSCRDEFTDGETSFSAAALVAHSGSISLRSDSSTTSTRSFAFPVLQSEWNGSPVRMAKTQKQKKKKGGWRHSILCCRF